MWPGTLWQPWPNFNAGIPGPQGGCGPRCIPRDLSGPRAIGWVRGWTRVESWRDVAGKKRSRKKKVDSCGHHTTDACISFAVIHSYQMFNSRRFTDNQRHRMLKKKFKFPVSKIEARVPTTSLASPGLAWLMDKRRKGKATTPSPFFFP